MQEKMLSRYKDEAKKTEDNPKSILELAHNALGKLERLWVIGKLFVRFFPMIRMLIAYAKGNYTGLSKQSAFLCLCALIYLISPLDFVPDFIPILGLLDDFVALTGALSKLNEELDKFLEWERSQESRGNESTEPVDENSDSNPSEL